MCVCVCARAYKKPFYYLIDISGYVRIAAHQFQDMSHISNSISDIITKKSILDITNSIQEISFWYQDIDFVICTYQQLTSHKFNSAMSICVISAVEFDFLITEIDSLISRIQFVTSEIDFVICTPHEWNSWYQNLIFWYAISWIFIIVESVNRKPNRNRV